MFEMKNQESKILLAITGASGIPYAKRLLEYLLQNQYHTGLVYSKTAQIVAKQECSWNLYDDVKQTQQQICQEFKTQSQYLNVVADDDWFAPYASGSNPADVMIICPASMGTVSAVANGSSNSLIERAADVCLKERKKLIIIPREMPLSSIHLKHLLQLSEYGAVIIPPSPAFYFYPKTVEDMVDFVVARVLDHIGIANKLAKRW